VIGAIDIRVSVTNVNDRLMPNVGALGQIVSFGEDARGELYLINISGSDSKQPAARALRGRPVFKSRDMVADRYRMLFSPECSSCSATRTGS
jgi:hypothetical protein